MSVDFFDSNVFVYLFDETDDHKRHVAERLIVQALEASNACISFQVVQETLNILTRKLKPAVSEPNAQRFLESVLQPLWRVMPSVALYQRGLALQARYKLSFYDALIVAAALEAGCKRLLSEDMQHGLRIEKLTIINPFAGD
jgi:predicted nucleic acid-binding protein